jgi:hypothetical protein
VLKYECTALCISASGMLGAGACGAKEVGPGTAADKVLPGAEMLEAFDVAVEASPTTRPAEARKEINSSNPFASAACFN